jgi:reactive intermediate/imine deaminase
VRLYLKNTVFLAALLFTSYLHAGEVVTFLNSDKAAAAGLPFSEAVRVGDTFYLSGQIGVLPGTMSLVPGGMEAEAKQTMDNIKATLHSHNLSMSNIVKCTVMMADISKWSIFNKVYVSYFEGNFPARSAFGANGLALGAQLEVECIAVDG